MADQITQTLNDVADGLRGPLATSITELIASEKAARERVAELEGTEVVQSAAADNVKSAFAEVAAKFTPVAEVPDVPELPETPSGEDTTTPGDQTATDPAAEAPITDGGTDEPTS